MLLLRNRFYRRQNTILENFSEVDNLMQEAMLSTSQRGTETQKPETNSEKMAMRISFGFNMILFAAKVRASAFAPQTVTLKRPCRHPPSVCLPRQLGNSPSLAAESREQQQGLPCARHRSAHQP